MEEFHGRQLSRGSCLGEVIQGKISGSGRAQGQSP